ncbi:MAG: hypothetical protein H6574_14980 [Lewinellaceae bacterium]|nr:hypothetical protein [Saprospiraceae bacterium]MCB9315263.1 hypothetical protein [Lewinellaceae bacterium]MCB9332383.1 hypothetical protein [Lewinellaceae bacterium]
MRYTIFLFFGLLASSIARAQSAEDAATPPVDPTNLEADSTDPAREAAALLTEKYTLDADQTAEVYTVQLRKQRNLAEILPLKTQNQPVYLNKLNSIQRGTQASIRRLLKTDAQRDLFQQSMADQRRLRAEKMRELQAKGASALAIEEAILEIYFE